MVQQVLASTLLVSFLFSSCESRNSGTDLAGSIFVEQDANGQMVSLRWQSKTIPVCWEQGDSSEHRAIMTAVQSSVAAAYAELGFQFSGWGTCNTISQGIRIAIDNTAPFPMTRRAPPAVPGAGRQLDGVIGGLILKTVFPERAQFGVCVAGASARQCTLIDAVHEFGHALGLAHEHDRADSECYVPGTQDGVLVTNTVAIGPYDADSIMNYCRTNLALESGEVLSLSAGDKQALADLYGNVNNSDSLTKDDSKAPGSFDRNDRDLTPDTIAPNCSAIGAEESYQYEIPDAQALPVTYCHCPDGKVIVLGRVPSGEKC